MTIFVDRTIAGVRAFGWQADVRFDGWLPLSVREGRNDDFGYVLRVPILGWVVCVGRM